MVDLRPSPISKRGLVKRFSLGLIAKQLFPEASLFLLLGAP